MGAEWLGCCLQSASELKHNLAVLHWTDRQLTIAMNAWALTQDAQSTTAIAYEAVERCACAIISIWMIDNI